MPQRNMMLNASRLSVTGSKGAVAVEEPGPGTSGTLG